MWISEKTALAVSMNVDAQRRRVLNGCSTVKNECIRGTARGKAELIMPSDNGLVLRKGGGRVLRYCLYSSLTVIIQLHCYFVFFHRLIVVIVLFFNFLLLSSSLSHNNFHLSNPWSHEYEGRRLPSVVLECYGDHVSYLEMLSCFIEF